VNGLYFPGYGSADANPDMGDSSITETAGIGGFAMAAAPAIVGFVGGTAADAIANTKEMYEICLSRNQGNHNDQTSIHQQTTNHTSQPEHVVLFILSLFLF